MTTYTEKEIQEWFETMLKKYPVGNMYDALKNVEFMMFYDTFDDTNKLKNIKKVIDK